MIFGVAVVNKKAGVDHAMRNRRGGRGRHFSLAVLDELDGVPLGIVRHKAQAMVRSAFDLRGLDSLRGQIAAQRDDVVGRERHVIHAVGRLRVGRGTVSDPLHSSHVSDNLAGFDGIG